MIKIASSGSYLPERRRALPVTGANFILLAGVGRVLADGHKKIFLYASRAPKPSTASSDS